MKKNKILGGLVCVFALLLASFALAEAADVTGPTEDVVVNVDYSDLEEDDESLTYTETLTFENTAVEVCNEVCTSCTEGEEGCNEVCDENGENCEWLTCEWLCCEEVCEEDFETVTLAATVLDGYTAVLSEETFDLLPGGTHEVTLTLTVPVDEDSGSHDVGDLTWTVDDVDTVVDITTEVKSMLKLDWLKVYVDGDKEDTIYGDESGEKTSDISPGSEVELRFNIENLFNDDDYDEGDLDDVLLTVEFADNDDEDDFDDEIDEEEEFDLDIDEETEIVFDFKVPGRADEKTYELLVKLEGEDGNGATHSVEWSVFLDIDREKDDVRIEKAYLQSETVLCGGETFLKVEVANYGSNSQDDVVLVITNDALGINVNVMDIELDKDPDDDDNSYTKTVLVVIGEDVLAGTFTFDVRVYVDGDEEVDHRLVPLTVIGCAGDEVVEEDEEVAEDEGVTVLAFDDDEETPGEGTTGITGGTVVGTVEATQSKGMTGFMIVVVVLLVILIALMLGVLLKR